MTSRREVITKCGLGIAGIIATGRAPAAIVKGLVGARESGLVGASKDFDNPYVSDGLVAMWDGIWNVGIGEHDSASTIWKDLVGDNDCTLTPPAVFGVNYMQSAFKCVPMKRYYAPASVRTIDVVLQNISGGCVWGMTTNYRMGLVCDSSSSLNGYNTYKQNNANNIVIKCDSKKINHIAITKEGTWQTKDCYLNGLPYSGVDIYNDVWAIGFGFGASENRGSVTKFYSARLYSRALTADEVAHNYSLDKERFGL